MQSSFQNHTTKIELKASEEVNKIRNLLLKDGFIVDEPTKNNTTLKSISVKVKIVQNSWFISEIKGLKMFCKAI